VEEQRAAPTGQIEVAEFVGDGEVLAGQCRPLRLSASSRLIRFTIV
jgi:hypothetical protein